LLTRRGGSKKAAASTSREMCHGASAEPRFQAMARANVYLSGLIAALRAYQPDVIDLYEEPFSWSRCKTLILRQLLAPSAALVCYSAVNVHRQWRWPYRWIERMVLTEADGAHVPHKDVVSILAPRASLARSPCR